MPTPHLARILGDLARPEAFPHPAPVEVVQTHASVVFLVGDEVFKVKKPLDLGFLDYSTLARREEMCRREVTLNRRTAPGVYLGVVPIAPGPDGRWRVGDGEVVEWAVHMRRVPDEATLRHAVRQGTLAPDDLVPVAQRLAAFHAEAERTPVAAEAASFETVARLARDNVRALARHADTLGRELVDALRAATEVALTEHEPRIRARAPQVSCAFHGDLRLEHVYRFPDRPPPGDVVILDGIEFDPILRHGDPVADLAFLVMDLQAYGAWDHAEVLAEAWFDAAGDEDGRALLPLYVSYRSAVRAKVATLLMDEDEVPADERAAACERAQRHLRLAVGALQAPRVRTRLLLTAGLPGSGKSTLARDLTRRLPLAVLRADVVRKELAGLDPGVDAADAPDAGLYAPEHTARTYEALRDRARRRLEAGQSVIVDAGFREASRRQPFLALAQALGVPAHVVVCEAPDDVLRDRLAQRRGDASDADAAILDHVRDRFEIPRGPGVVVVDTTAHDAVGQVLDGLGA